MHPHVQTEKIIRSRGTQSMKLIIITLLCVLYTVVMGGEGECMIVVYK